MVPIHCKILDKLTDPVFVNSTDGIYTACNGAFAELVNIPKHKILGRTIFDVWPGYLANLYVRSDRELRQQQGEQRLRSCVTTSKASQKIWGVYYKTLIDDDLIHGKNAVLGVFKADNEPAHTVAAAATSLTNREIEIITLASKGLPNKIIASNLGISIHTVAEYFKNIHVKLDVHKRMEAVAIARSLNLIIT